jgi:hypothetical protein
MRNEDRAGYLARVCSRWRDILRVVEPDRVQEPLRERRIEP